MEETLNLHTMYTVCICYVLCVYHALEDFHLFSNDIPCILASFEKRNKANTE